MTIRKAALLILLTATGLYLNSCSGDDDALYSEIPDGPVNITINLDLPLYFYMQNMGSFSYHPGGHKGVVVIHNFDDEYYAFERTCTHQPDLTCSIVEVDSTLLDLRCGSYEAGQWVPCCDSRFFFNGQVEQGPARLPLKPFQVSKNGSVLTVRN